MLVEDHGLDTRLREQIAEQMGLGQRGSGAESMHAAV
jgi:hypothetical protein